jgi:Ser/Thr protein kinase RdoA (MazF antagonist)
MAQPRSEHDFGLIHSDAHAGNFFADSGRLTFFDFDDACYCWFAYDVATILLSAVLQQWIGDKQAEREAAAREFLPRFLEGYSSACEMPPTLLEQLPLSLKFREICLYGVIKQFVTLEERNWYTDKFMAGRRERIERDEPYLALDFL